MYAMIICKGPQQGSITQDFFFLKLKLFSQLAQANPGAKQGLNSDGPESVPAKRFPTSTLEPNFGVERENVTGPWSCEQPHKSGQWPCSLSQLAATEPEDMGQTQPWAGRMALGSAGETGRLSENFATHTPLKALPNCFIGLCSRLEFPHGHFPHSHGQGEECLG